MYEESVVFGLPLFQGRCHDLLILLLQKSLASPNTAAVSLQQSFLSILFNVSPFVKQISVQAATALTQLVGAYMSPAWLLKDSDSFLQLKIVLDSIFNILTYNYEENPMLALALMNQAKRYTKFSESHLRDVTELKSRIEEAKFASQDTDEDKEEKEEKKVAGREQPWSPSEQWYEESKSHLPLKPLLLLLSHVSSRLERAYMVYEATEKELVDLVRRVSLVGVQDETMKFAFLHFDMTPELERWLDRYMWQVVYLKNQRMNMFHPGRVRYMLQSSAGAAPESKDQEEEEKEIKKIEREERPEEKAVEVTKSEAAPAAKK